MKLVSFGRSVSCGAARETASEKIEKKRGKRKRKSFLQQRLSPIFSFAVFCAASQLTEHLEEAKSELEVK